MIEIISPLSIQLLSKPDKNSCKTLTFVFLISFFFFCCARINLTVSLLPELQNIFLHFSYLCMKNIRYLSTLKNKMTPRTFPKEKEIVYHSGTPQAKPYQFEHDKRDRLSKILRDSARLSKILQAFTVAVSKKLKFGLQVAFAWVPICIGEMAVFIITKPLLFLSSKRCHAQS